MSSLIERGKDVHEEETSPDGRYIRFSLKLGSGAYKTVWLCYDTDSGRECAWNVVDLKRVPDRERSRLSAETKLLASLKNENILTFLGVWEANQQVCFVTEIVTSGTLKQYINRVFDKGIKLKIIQKWCRQIASGLDYLHSHEPPIIHRDIKCDNIFINGHSADICIGDLGLSTEKTRTHAESVLGTPEFMAPELYEERYTEKVDVYAFGMALLEMVTNEYPFAECSNSAQIYRKVMKGEGPAAIQRIETRSIKDFVELCLMPPERRLSSHDLLEHPFLALRNSDPRRENAQVVLTPKIDEEAVAATTSRKSIVDPGHGAESDSSKLRARSHSKLTVQTPVNQESPAISSPTTVTSPPTHSPPLQTPPLNSGGQTVATPNPLLSSASSALSTPPVPAVSTPQPPPSQQSTPQPLQPQAVTTPAIAQNPALTSQPSAPVTVSTPSPSPAPPQLVDVVVASGTENKLNMRLRIRINNANKDIKFPFDSNTDTAAQVATEMVQALNLAADQQASIATHIDEAIVKFRAAAASTAAAEAAASAVSAAAALPATVVPPASGLSAMAAVMPPPESFKPTYAAIAAAPVLAAEPVVAALPVAVLDAVPAAPVAPAAAVVSASVSNVGGSAVPTPSAPASVVSSQQSQTSHQQATDKSSDHSSHKSSGKTETCAADTAKAVEEQLRLELQGRPITDLLRRFQSRASVTADIVPSSALPSLALAHALEVRPSDHTAPLAVPCVRLATEASLRKNQMDSLDRRRLVDALVCLTCSSATETSKSSSVVSSPTLVSPGIMLPEHTSAASHPSSASSPAQPSLTTPTASVSSAVAVVPASPGAGLVRPPSQLPCIHEDDTEHPHEHTHSLPMPVAPSPDNFDVPLLRDILNSFSLKGLQPQLILSEEEVAVRERSRAEVKAWIDRWLVMLQAFEITAEIHLRHSIFSAHGLLERTRFDEMPLPRARPVMMQLRDELDTWLSSAHTTEQPLEVDGGFRRSLHADTESSHLLHQAVTGQSGSASASTFVHPDVANILKHRASMPALSVSVPTSSAGCAPCMSANIPSATELAMKKAFSQNQRVDAHVHSQSCGGSSTLAQNRLRTASAPDEHVTSPPVNMHHHHAQMVGAPLAWPFPSPPAIDTYQPHPTSQSSTSSLQSAFAQQLRSPSNDPFSSPPPQSSDSSAADPFPPSPSEQARRQKERAERELMEGILKLG